MLVMILCHLKSEHVTLLPGYWLIPILCVAIKKQENDNLVTNIYLSKKTIIYLNHGEGPIITKFILGEW